MSNTYRVGHSCPCWCFLVTIKEAWFKIRDNHGRFGLDEFAFVIDLIVGDCEDLDKTLEQKCRIVKKYFKKSGGKIMKGDVYNVFVS